MTEELPVPVRVQDEGPTTSIPEAMEGRQVSKEELGDWLLRAVPFLRIKSETEILEEIRADNAECQQGEEGIQKVLDRRKAELCTLQELSTQFLKHPARDFSIALGPHMQTLNARAKYLHAEIGRLELQLREVTGRTDHSGVVSAVDHTSGETAADVAQVLKTAA